MKPNSRRIVAVVGALAVTGVTAVGVIAGTATAAGTGTCTSSVNVRSEPSETAPIVGVCERGESTSLGETEDGFVELPEFGGWAVADYVSTTGTSSSPRTGSSEDSLTPSSSERSASPTTSPRSSSSDDEGSAERSGTPSDSTESTDSTDSTDSTGPSGTSDRSAGPSSERSASPSESFFSDDD